jgi:CheY-like chemotaxis protein
MPQAALELGAADEVLPLDKVAGWLMDQVQMPKPKASTDSPLADALMQAAESSPARKRILVVDDSPIVLESTRVTLEAAGYEVKTLDNPLMVPSTVRRERFDLVMLDVSMPVVQGDQVMKALKDHELSNAPVILFSDREESALRELAQNCGAAGWIRKAAGPRALVDAVKRYAK